MAPDFTFDDFQPDAQVDSLWPPDWSPAVRTWADGLSYLEVTQWWRDRCRGFPCSVWLDWPGYATAAYPTLIDGTPVIIQAWKGWCQQFPLEVGPVIFPGGIGAEVGIYTTVPPWDQGLAGPTAPIAPQLWPIDLKNAFDRWIKRRFSDLDAPENTQGWWPLHSWNTDVKFTFTDPEFEEPLIADYRSSSYWTCKWMEKASYLDWRKDHKRIQELAVSPVLDPDQYLLEFTVAGIAYRWAENGIQPV